MFVALSRFAVANGMEAEVCAAFRERPHLVDGAAGFVRMDVVRPVADGREFWLITYWTDQDSFETWHNSAEHKASHVGIPKGLKLLPGRQQVEFFEHVAS